MAVFITGATGYVGHRLALALADEGVIVHALCRSAGKAALLAHPNIRLIEGDLTDENTLREGLRGCSGVFHLAAYASVWHPDPAHFHRVNVLGTDRVLQAALAEGVNRVVLTSTAGVMGPSPGRGQEVDEYTNPDPPLDTQYERTKWEAERRALLWINKGLEVVIVNPSRIYGPGQLSESNAVTRMIDLFSQGRWRVVPHDGESIGNYVFIDDVVRGHRLAMDKCFSGERYILGGENVSYNELFGLLRELTGQRQRLFHLPLPVMLGFAKVQETLARSFGLQPLITPPFVRKYNHHWSLSSAKAITELGYQITPLQEGIRRTLQWINEKKNQSHE